MPRDTRAKFDSHRETGGTATEVRLPRTSVGLAGAALTVITAYLRKFVEEGETIVPARGVTDSSKIIASFSRDARSRKIPRDASAELAQ